MCISKERNDELMQDQGLPEKPVYDANPEYSLYFGYVIYATKDLGAVLLEDEMWHPFRYFDDGEMDICDDAFYKPSSAFNISVVTYT